MLFDIWNRLSWCVYMCLLRKAFILLCSDKPYCCSCLIVYSGMLYNIRFLISSTQLLWTSWRKKSYCSEAMYASDVNWQLYVAWSEKKFKWQFRQTTISGCSGPILFGWFSTSLSHQCWFHETLLRNIYGLCPSRKAMKQNWPGRWWEYVQQHLYMMQIRWRFCQLSGLPWGCSLQ